jgi:hypothetical protein
VLNFARRATFAVTVELELAGDAWLALDIGLTLDLDEVDLVSCIVGWLVVQWSHPSLTSSGMPTLYDKLKDTSETG